MADTAINTGTGNNMGNFIAEGGHWACSPAAGVAYAMIQTSANDLVYHKFASGSWGTAQTIHTGTAWQYAAYYDQWTKGVSTNKWIMAWNDSGADDTLFDALDLDDDTLDNGDGSAVQVFAGATYSAGSPNTRTAACDIVRAEGGNIYVWFDGDDGTEFGFYRSTNGGTSFTSRATTGLWETEDDQLLLLPGNEADTNDIYALYIDSSAGEMTLKVYDDSADSWSESAAIDSSIHTTLDSRGSKIDAAQRHSDGHIIAVVNNREDNAVSDLRVYDITNATTFSEVAGSPIIENTLDAGINPRICINQQNDDLYVVYLGKDDGTENWLTTGVGCYYVLSTDDGATFGTEQAMSVDAVDDHRATAGMTSIDASGGEFMPLWWDDDDNDAWCNLDNKIAISASGGAADQEPSLVGGKLVNHGILGRHLVHG